MNDSSLTIEVENVCLGAGDLEFYKTETGIEGGMEDSICRSILLQSWSCKYKKYVSLLIRRFSGPNILKTLLLVCQFSCSEVLSSPEAFRPLTPHFGPSTSPGRGF